MRLTLLFIILSCTLSYSQSRDTLKTIDKAGNVIKIQFNDNGKLSNYLIHYQYDKENRLIKEYTTDTFQNILSRIGLAPILIYEYKVEKDNTIKIEYCFDKNMKPDVLDMAPFYHKVIHTSNSKGLVIERWGLSKSDDTKFRIAYSYNENGLESQIKYLDAEGNIEKGFVGIVELEYDNKNRLISEKNYDYLHKPFLSKNIPFKKGISYIGDIQCIKYYDENLKEIEQKKFPTCEKAPNFKVPNEKGKIVSLNKFKGKTVVLYFWTTKSFLTKYQNPKLLTLHNEYKDKNVEFIFIAIQKEEDKEEWIKSIKDTKVDWAINVCDFKHFDSDVVKNYRANASKFFVINPDGIVIGSDLGGVWEVKEVLDNSLKE